MHDLVERVAAVDAGCTDRVVLETAVGTYARLKSWVESREVAVARQLATVASFPEKALADAGRTSVRQAEQAVTAVLRPPNRCAGFGVSLDAGRVSADHVDVLTRTLRHLDPGCRERLAADGAGWCCSPKNSTAEEFARTMRAEARRVETDSDGLDRLERQRRAVRLNTWIERRHRDGTLVG